MKRSKETENRKRKRRKEGKNIKRPQGTILAWPEF
jgi:hypothetical protein